jgi:hypothetical protein
VSRRRRTCGPVKHRVTIQRDGSPVYEAEVDADSKREAVEKVLARASTPEWAINSRWQDVVVDELPERP